MRKAFALAFAGWVSLVAAQSPDQRLFEAIEAGKPLVAEGLVIDGLATPNVRDASGETPLHRAVDKGMRELAVLLLKAGARPDARSASGETALHLAALHADPSLARLLLDAGANPRARNDDGETPLHWAALSGNAQTARLLLERGADAGIADIRGNLPLHGAADGGDAATVRLLLAATRKRDTKNRAGETAAEVARARGYESLARLIAGSEPRTERPPPHERSQPVPKQGLGSKDLDDPEHPRFQSY